jgi:hypothetical protein
MEILGKILGNPARVKIMRLFLSNQGKHFTSKDVSKRSRVNQEVARKEIRLLSSISFLKKKGDGWCFNPVFKYGEEFESLLLGLDNLDSQSIINNFKKAGRIKLIIISGVFIKNDDSRVDLLVVGDKIRRGRIEEEIRKIEAEMGRELVYAIFETQEFLYRLNMYDKLVRDIVDYPHEVVFETKELSTQLLKKA